MALTKIQAQVVDSNSISSIQVIDRTLVNDDLADYTLTSQKLANTGVSASTYGGSSQIPVINIDEAGRVTSAANIAVSLGTIASQDADNVDITGGDITGLFSLEVNGLSTFIGSTAEKANIQASGAGANITADLSSAPVLYFTGNTTTNSAITINFTDSPIISVGNVMSYVVLLTNTANANGYISAVQIDGTPANTTVWAGGRPAAGLANVEVYSFSIFRTDTSTFNVIGSLANYQ